MRLLRRLLPLLPRTLRDRVIRSLVKIDEDAIRGLVVKVASTVDEHVQAARLMQRVYERRGIAPSHASGVRVTPHLLMPSACLFVAKRGAEVVGTIALLCDDALGLPMESIYGAEVTRLRATGRRIAEVGALALAPGYRHCGTVYLLNRAMADHAREALGVQDLVVAVHPDAADYYRANMTFDLAGPVRAYPGLTARALAVAMHLDLTTHREVCSRFGAAARASNPHWLYFVRENPQIEVRRDDVAVSTQRAARRAAARTLLALRPECLAELDEHRRAWVLGAIAEQAHAA